MNFVAAAFWGAPVRSVFYADRSRSNAVVVGGRPKVALDFDPRLPRTESRNRRRATVECGDLSPLSQGDLSPSNSGRGGERMGHSRLAPAPARPRGRSRTEVRRRQVACAKAVTSHRTPKLSLRDDMPTALRDSYEEQSALVLLLVASRLTRGLRVSPPGRIAGARTPRNSQARRLRYRAAVPRCFGRVRTAGAVRVVGRPAGLETRDTADLEVCGTREQGADPHLAAGPDCRGEDAPQLAGETPAVHLPAARSRPRRLAMTLPSPPAY